MIGKLDHPPRTRRRQYTVRTAAAVAAGTALALAGAACATATATRPVASATAAAPPLKVLTALKHGTGDDIFIAPTGGGYRSGLEIVSPKGRVAWFRALPAGQHATDFRTQTYLGQPVLTWWQSGGKAGPADYIDNVAHHQIAVVRAGDGDVTNFHEFLITPWNTALITASTVATANLTSIGGPARQKVTDGIVQEIDIKTGRVLFWWDSAGHVPYRDSQVPRPALPTTAWDWFHLNAVHLDTDRYLLINSRFTWTTYKVSLSTGKIIWELGGRQSTFRLLAGPGQVLDQAGEIFAFQHDPEAIGPSKYTFFDDESNGVQTLLGHSRAVTVRLDLADKTATLVKSVAQPEGLVATAEGSAQTTSGGDLFVGWGTLPYVSEFSPSGRLIFNAELPPGVTTYRAYLLPWPPAT
jgi:hypothetical protein